MKLTLLSAFEATGNTRRRTIKELKILFATHQLLFVSDLTADIARSVNVTPDTLNRWVNAPEWQEALAFWGSPPSSLARPVKNAINTVSAAGI